MEALVYLDGQIIPESEAKISVFDLSILRGYGVFDFLRTYQKRPFHLWDHLKRFEASANEIEIPMPLSLNEVAEIIEKLLQKTSCPEANIKVFLTGGCSPDQYLPQGDPTFFATVYPVIDYPKALYEQGVLSRKHRYMSALIQLVKVFIICQLLLAFRPRLKDKGLMMFFLSATKMKS